MTLSAAPRPVYFSVRTRGIADVIVAKEQAEKALGLTLTPYIGNSYEPPTFETTILGIWIILTEVRSTQADAPQRFQLQGRQRLSDDADFADEIHLIDDYILHVLDRQAPGCWYHPSKAEARIDVGLDEGRIQDLPSK